MNPGDPLPEGHLLDGRYRIKRVLGVGGMGRVYLSNDTRLAHRPVAVKEMVIADGVAEKKAIEDFAREANVLAKLSHPGIPSVFDNFVENARHYLVMEFVAGGDLQAMLDELGPKARLEENRVLRWARQILEVLDFLHAQKPPIIYRDLKPGNVMIDKDGRAMLIDFGIARFLPPGGRGTQIGSVGYAPPEQYMGKVEPRSDLYSLAATMHHLLSGRDPQLEPPFSFPPLRDLAPGISPMTAGAVMKALEQDVNKRFDHARKMLRELPEPPPEPKRSGVLARSASIQSPSGSIGRVPSALHPKSSPASAARAPTPPSLLNPVAQPGSAGHAPETVMPTMVLTKPADAASRREPSAAAKRVVPQIKKAIELGGRARALIERRLMPRLVSPEPAAPSISSTAKTKELNRQVAASYAAVSASTGDSSRTNTNSRSSASKRAKLKSADLFANNKPSLPEPPKVAQARLIARGENLEFGIFGLRAVIGRSQDGSGSGAPPDVDLGALKRGAERVSRRHAEIVKRGADFFIRDLGSLNGTYIAGRGKLGRDQLYKLNDRDQVVLGGAILQFRRG